MIDTTDPADEYVMRPIGRVHSCFREKFGIPRQPGLTRHAYGSIELFTPYNREEALRGLDSFSHLWVEFIFHQNAPSQRTTARPPRLGGNQRMGTLATRSSFRPNRLGLSVVELIGIEPTGDTMQLNIRGLDLVDQTPVLDIKPYLPYADAPPSAAAGWVGEAPQASTAITFSPDAESRLAELAGQGFSELRLLIEDILSLDPRPAYRKGKPDDREYGIRLYDFDVHWQMSGDGKIEVVRIQ